MNVNSIRIIVTFITHPPHYTPSALSHFLPPPHTLIQVPKHCSVLNRFGMFSENSGSLRVRCNVLVTDARTSVMKHKAPTAEQESNVRYARMLFVRLFVCQPDCLFSYSFGWLPDCLFIYLSVCFLHFRHSCQYLTLTPKAQFYFSQ